MVSLSQREILQFGEVPTNRILFKNSFDEVHRVLPTTFEDFDPSLLVGTSYTGISDVFLQQTLLTFTEDPFHQRYYLIPDCGNNNFWSELGLGLGETILNCFNNIINVRVVGEW